MERKKCLLKALLLSVVIIFPVATGEDITTSCIDPLSPRQAHLPTLTEINSKKQAHHAPDPSRYKRVIHSAQEAKSYELKQKHELMSEDERNAHRRQSAERFRVCPQGPLPEHESYDCVIPGLQVSIFYRKGLTFCRDCMDAHEYGSYIDIWDAHHGPVNYHVDGTVVYGVPNHGGKRVLNEEHAKNRIVLFDRGGDVPIARKILNAQKVGALAVIIVDNGQCDTDFNCGVLGSRNAIPYKGFAAKDYQAEWKGIHIPAVLIHSEAGKRLKKGMDLETIRVPGYGDQWMTSGL